MTIAAILSGKGDKVVSVECDTPVREAVRLLAEHRIGSPLFCIIVIRPLGQLDRRGRCGC